MTIFIASDIHGSGVWCEKMLRAFDASGASRLVLLGDILYHGPRNDLPDGYDPRRVIELLSPYARRILAVRGNCEAEVDQMVLDFPCMADYSVLWDPDATNPATDERGRELFLTHGHVWGPGIHNSIDRMPALPAGAALVYGHTHKKVNQASASHPDIWCFNPGSVGIPKDGTHSYGIYEDGEFRHVVLGE